MDCYENCENNTDTSEHTLTALSKFHMQRQKFTFMYDLKTTKKAHLLVA